MGGKGGKKGGGSTYLVFSQCEVAVIAAAELFLVLLMVFLVDQSGFGGIGIGKIGHGGGAAGGALEAVDVGAVGLRLRHCRS